MTPEQRGELHGLLASERVLAIAVLIGGEPYAGLLPYAFVPEEGAALVHASRLARHTRGLTPGAPVSVLVHRPDRPEADPLQVPRVTLTGTVELVERGSAAYEGAQRRYVDRFPTSAPTFQLGDFELYRLRFSAGRYVGGFAQAVNVTRQDLEHLASLSRS
jgi:putative heme iron utilization protein